LLAGAITSAIVIGYTLNLLNDASTVYSNKAVPAGIHVAAETLSETSTIHDPAHKDDTKTYKVFRIRDQLTTGPLAALTPGKYLADDSGEIKYLVDPGINGILQNRDDGTPVQKFEAPKARLMSLIIDGILSQKLPWGLVLLGAAIALLMELCGISSLPFAVGVYLPMSTSAPIFFGGLVRWAVDKMKSTASKPHAEDDSGPGVLFSSGLIAGGSIAGIVLAILAMSGSNFDMSGFFAAFSLSEWGAMIAFVVISGMLYKTARSDSPTI
jgi:OPT oligopeptide transporter protein